ncbi:Phosphoenolpyruvate/pyruvate domain-containing protein [Zopfia rhizophila CBS 207.26]|uniref:Phosphoenolpyruvate/pyruvate domain-containing protein n=1 Tax=Zopfia rhizophila CBS 207.26 TaxID=1314779 RepID=A0A6A6DDK9_9PEZI|nr:Phosphoenolpyruvate/pyruvate domain-containing protein [Zopfia rhizophila CBS 207.26]
MVELRLPIQITGFVVSGCLERRARHSSQQDSYRLPLVLAMKNATKSGVNTFRDGLVSGPRGFGGISTRVASAVGFDFLYLAGSGATGSYLAEPDLFSHDSNQVSKGRRDDGLALPLCYYCGRWYWLRRPFNIDRTIRLYKHASMAGCHIENQVFQKRCGQPKGKDVVNLKPFINRIRSAVESHMYPDFVIIAHMDARFPGGYSAAEGCGRSRGGHGFHGESPYHAGVRNLVKELASRPVMINVLPRLMKYFLEGLTPDLSTADSLPWR